MITAFISTVICEDQNAIIRCHFHPSQILLRTLLLSSKTCSTLPNFITLSTYPNNTLSGGNSFRPFFAAGQFWWSRFSPTIITTTCSMLRSGQVAGSALDHVSIFKNKFFLTRKCKNQTLRRVSSFGHHVTWMEKERAVHGRKKTLNLIKIRIHYPLVVRGLSSG